MDESNCSSRSSPGPVRILGTTRKIRATTKAQRATTVTRGGRKRGTRKKKLDRREDGTIENIRAKRDYPSRQVLLKMSSNNGQSAGRIRIDLKPITKLFSSLAAVTADEPFDKVAAAAFTASVKKKNQDEGKDNNDYCSACGTSGFMLCCEGCPRSFHLSCLDPPLDPLQIPTGSWYCAACGGALVSGKKTTTTTNSHIEAFWEAAVEGLVGGNPKCFLLPKELRRKTAHPQPRPRQCQRRERREGREKSVQVDEEEEGHLLSNLGLCHGCGRRARMDLPAPVGLLLRCTRCPLRWHLDCIDDPPPTSLPRRTPWICPAHLPAHLCNPAVQVRLEEQEQPVLWEERRIRLDFWKRRQTTAEVPKVVGVAVPPAIAAYYADIRSMTARQLVTIFNKHS